MVSMTVFDGSNFEMNNPKVEPFASNLETIISNVERWAMGSFTSRSFMYLYMKVAADRESDRSFDPRTSAIHSIFGPSTSVRKSNDLSPE
ncbi:hypothetical protein EGT36_21100 [Agrobacterium sp. FDAARGOS_525]|nr:hypothetical protein EGT36_21100 [Agrobacterium sp. FDAARGOS_525]